MRDPDIIAFRPAPWTVKPAARRSLLDVVKSLAIWFWHDGAMSDRSNLPKAAMSKALPVSASRLRLPWALPAWLVRALGTRPVAVEETPSAADVELQAEITQLQDRLVEKDVLLATRDRAIALASHELRTPLNGILGMADLLEHTALTPEQTSYVRTIANSAAALVNLVDDMLDAGKMASGHWRLRPRPVDLVAWIEEITELLAPRAQSKGLELAAYVAAGVPARVEADPEQLTRIVMNLAGNAIKYTERGGVTIEITADGAGPEARLKIIVRDSGIGIAAIDQARIFAAYEQADSTYVAAMPGTGLGLAIARAIASAMEADLSVESNPGEGAQFTLELSVPVLEATINIARPFTGRRFLMVSTSTIEFSVLMRRLFDLGAIVDCASSQTAAADMIRSGDHFDAVLIDIDGDIDADVLATLCRQTGRSMVALTTPVGRKSLDRLRGAGMTAHLIKPIRTQTLQRILGNVIDGRSETQGSVDVRADSIGQRASIGLRVLLADDNEINTLLAISMIGRHGHQIETVDNGAAAIERAAAARTAHEPFDVIFMDLHMPVVDGFGAIRAIRAEEAAGHNRCKIIALTADATVATAEAALAAGADLALTKPVSATRLAEVLAEIEVGRESSRMLVGAGVMVQH
jgi:signal transduction histidine kinase/CheY-like chemotaxis protein